MEYSPGPEQCCRGSHEWKRRLDQSPISLVLLVGMRAVNVLAIGAGVVAIYLGTLCLVEDMGLGGWASVFFSVGLTEIGVGLFGIYATYFHIWLLFYLFAMVLLWLTAIWLALFLPGYYATLEHSLLAAARSGGLQVTPHAILTRSTNEKSFLSSDCVCCSAASSQSRAPTLRG